MKWASALSREQDASAALAACVESVRATLGAPDVKLLLLFISPRHAPDAANLIRTLRAAFPSARLLGCTAGGVIGGGAECEDLPAMSLTAARLPGVDLDCFHLDDGDLPQLDVEPAALVLLAEPFTCDPVSLLEALDLHLPNCAKVGGLASGGTSEEEHLLILDDRLLHHGAIGAALSGDIDLTTLVAQGCRPVGPRMKVTRARGHMLEAVDGLPPLQVVAALHAAASGGDRHRMKHSLFVGLAAQGSKDLLVRNILGIDPEHGALSVAGVLEQGQTLQFMLRDGETAEEELRGLLHGAVAETPTAPAGTLVFSCIGRGRALYGHEGREAGLFEATWGGAPLGGFFGNGEIGPLGGRTRVHGCTSAFAMFRPRRH